MTNIRITEHERPGGAHVTTEEGVNYVSSAQRQWSRWAKQRNEMTEQQLIEGDLANARRKLADPFDQRGADRAMLEELTINHQQGNHHGF